MRLKKPLYNFTGWEKKSSRRSTRLHEDGSEEDGKREAQGEDVEGVREGVNEKKGVMFLGDALCQASCIMLLTLSLGRAG